MCLRIIIEMVDTVSHKFSTVLKTCKIKGGKSCQKSASYPYGKASTYIYMVSSPLDTTIVLSKFGNVASYLFHTFPITLIIIQIIDIFFFKLIKLVDLK